MMHNRMPITSIQGSFKPNQGFTLIELMIAISILTMLLFAGSYSYSLISERWNKELGHFNQASKNAKHLELLQHVLEGTVSYIVVDKKKDPSFFFIGGEQSLLAISQNGLFSNESPEIYRLTAAERSPGFYDLIYQSASTKNILLIGTEQNIKFTHSFVLFSGLTEVNFRYFGWKSLTEKAERNLLKPAVWQSQFSGIDQKLMPQKFELMLGNDKGSIAIPIMLEDFAEKKLTPYINTDT